MTTTTEPLIRVDGDGLERMTTGGRADRGWFFLSQFELDRGDFEAEFEVDFPDVGADVSLEAVAWRGPKATYLAREEFRIIEPIRSKGLYRLRFDVAEPVLVQLRGHTDPSFESTNLDVLRIRKLGDAPRPRPAFDEGLAVLNSPHRPAWPVDRLRCVIVGTTSICNASCVHCPTNKPMTRHLPNKLMSIELFESLILGLRDLGLPIDGAVGLGLYAESLLDPLIVERSAFVKRHLPDASLVINTNGGPLDDDLIERLSEHVDCFCVHIEAVDPSLYHRLMRPLRAEVVFPKVERLIRDSGKPVTIVCPVHSRNLREFPAVRDYWMSRGACDVSPTFLWNRCTEALGFSELALAPGPGRCGAEVAHDLVVDWDGAVLACCQDFLKRNKIGDLKAESVAELLANSGRRDVFEALGAGRWDSFESCKNCRCDSMGTVKMLIDHL